MNSKYDFHILARNIFFPPSVEEGGVGVGSAGGAAGSVRSRSHSRGKKSGSSTKSAASHRGGRESVEDAILRVYTNDIAQKQVLDVVFAHPVDESMTENPVLEFDLQGTALYTPLKKRVKSRREALNPGKDESNESEFGFKIEY